MIGFKADGLAGTPAMIDIVKPTTRLGAALPFPPLYPRFAPSLPRLIAREDAASVSVNEWIADM